MEGISAVYDPWTELYTYVNPWTGYPPLCLMILPSKTNLLSVVVHNKICLQPITVNISM